MSDEVRAEGFYWAILGQNPPEIAYRERQHELQRLGDLVMAVLVQAGRRCRMRS
jgi:hypothetical protein